MKRISVLAAALCASATLYAGGLNTNTNQNAAFLRQMSQEAIIDINGLYMNPAGTAFLSKGSHLNVSFQNAKQSRDITTTFSLFKLNTNDPSFTHKFEGEALAPVIPSFMYSYNFGNWSLFGSMALTGGGGKCEFNKGLGTFEALYAGQMYSQVPAAVNAQLPGMVGQGLLAAGVPSAYISTLTSPDAGAVYLSNLTGYSLNAYMKGKQYYFGLTVGGTYKILENLAVSTSVRGVYAMCNYNGYVEDVKATYNYEYQIPAVPGLFPGTQGAGTGETSLDDKSLALNADQTGIGFTPIIGIDYKINDQWNIAAKYEFKTRMRLENKSEMNAYTAAMAASNATLGQFADGTKIAADIPSFFAAGVQYSPIQSLRIQTGYHLYGDKNATQYNNKQDNIDKNTWEMTAGVEYDICKWVTASCGWQTTLYGLSDAYMNDLSFVTNSNSIGLGVNVYITEHCSIDLAYMKTFYDKREVATPTAAGDKIDIYERTNRVLGIGFNFQF